VSTDRKSGRAALFFRLPLVVRLMRAQHMQISNG
jgi:hypothetical protein